MSNKHSSDEGAFVTVLGGTLFLAVIAVILSLLLRTPLPPQIELNANDVFIGIIATLPLALLLAWFSNTKIRPLAEFRRSQIEFFYKMKSVFTPTRIILLAIAAGISEELLFRGVMQPWLDKFIPLPAAIIVSNIIFGLLHVRTMLYAVAAGLVGVYLGVLYAITGNLLTPIIVHIIYDAIAFEYTRRAIIQIDKQ